METIYAFMYERPLWGVCLSLLLAMLVARAIGASIKRRIQSREPDTLQNEQDEGHIVAAVLGLLALLIAFTFGLALDRYETRRELVVREAKALEAAYMRTSLVAEPEPLRQALRVYTRERLRYGRAAVEGQLLAEAHAQPEEAALWLQTMVAVEPIKATAAGVFVSTPINDAIDIALERRAILSARLPKSVIGALMVYVIVSAGILGYAVPGNRGHHWITSVALFGLSALAITLILDLDRPRTGTIQIPQAPMQEALEAMRQHASPEPVSKR